MFSQEASWYADILDGTIVKDQKIWENKLDHEAKAFRKAQKSHDSYRLGELGSATATTTAPDQCTSFEAAKKWVEFASKPGNDFPVKLGGYSATESAVQLPACWLLWNEMVSKNMIHATKETKQKWTTQLQNQPDLRHPGAPSVDIRGVWLLTPLLWLEWARWAEKHLSDMWRPMLEPEDMQEFVGHFVSELSNVRVKESKEAYQYMLATSEKPDLHMQIRPEQVSRVRDVYYPSVSSGTTDAAKLADEDYLATRAGKGCVSFQDFELPALDEIPGGVLNNPLTVKFGIVDNSRTGRDSYEAGKSSRERAAWDPSMTKDQYLKLGMEAGVWYMDPKHLGGEDAVEQAKLQSMVSAPYTSLYGDCPDFGNPLGQ